MSGFIGSNLSQKCTFCVHFVRYTKYAIFIYFHNKAYVGRTLDLRHVRGIRPMYAGYNYF